jgi:hypothetical protein
MNAHRKNDWSRALAVSIPTALAAVFALTGSPTTVIGAQCTLSVILGLLVIRGRVKPKSSQGRAGLKRALAYIVAYVAIVLVWVVPPIALGGAVAIPRWGHWCFALCGLFLLACVASSSRLRGDPSEGRLLATCRVGAIAALSWLWSLGALCSLLVLLGR